jgi:hypothetical protein
MGAAGREAPRPGRRPRRSLTPREFGRIEIEVGPVALAASRIGPPGVRRVTDSAFDPR